MDGGVIGGVLGGVASLLLGVAGLYTAVRRGDKAKPDDDTDGAWKAVASTLREELDAEREERRRCEEARTGDHRLITELRAKVAALRRDLRTARARLRERR